MIRIEEALRRWLESHGRGLAAIWPVTTLTHRLRCRHEARLADTLLEGLASLDRLADARGCYADITRAELQKVRRTVASLTGKATAARDANRAGTLTTTTPQLVRLRSLEQQVAQLHERDKAWRGGAKRLRTERTELWEQATGWSPTWQKTITGFVAEVDNALKFGPKARNPEEQLKRAARWIDRVRVEVAYVATVGDMARRSARVASQVERIKPTAATYLAQDVRSFRETLSAGEERFAAGDYVTAHRHFEAVFALARRIVATERADRLKRKQEARQWIDLLGHGDEGARALASQLATALATPADGDFRAEWEALQKRIDDHVLRRACEMGKRDQKHISQRIGIKRTVRWQAQMDWKELVKFAESVVREL